MDGVEKLVSCKGICHRYKAKRIEFCGRYSEGQKRCQICEMYMFWKGLRCPCCKQRLRSTPRTPKSKSKYRQIMMTGQRRY